MLQWPRWQFDQSSARYWRNGRELAHHLDIGVMAENWPIIQLSFLVKTIRWLKFGTMLTHRLRCWANIDPTLPIIQLWNAFPANTTRFLKAGPGLGRRWATIDPNLGERLVFAGLFRSHFSLGRVIWRWPIIHPMPSGHFFPLGVAFGGGRFDETPAILLYLLVPGQTFEVAETSQLPAPLKAIKAQDRKWAETFTSSRSCGLWYEGRHSRSFIAFSILEQKSIIHLILYTL